VAEVGAGQVVSVQTTLPVDLDGGRSRPQHAGATDEERIAILSGLGMVRIDK
jgi:uncharacterized cupin superfamily protein